MKHFRWRYLLVLLLLPALSGCVRVVAHVLDVDPGQSGVEITMNAKVPMPDGTNLAIDIYQPKGNGPFPAVLTILPYGTDARMFTGIGKLFARNGYVFLAEDCRGTENSEGKWFPLVWDWDDGHETLAWIEKQPWFDGNLGM